MAISYSGCTCGAGGGSGGDCECPPTCVTTTCVLRCDDTNGDGQPDVTYSELWCIKQDGTSELVLTYQDDPSTPYTPVAPVDCEHGNVQCHTETLCDSSGSFLRRYTFLSNGTALYVDVDLDGQTPHVVVPPVRDCAAEPCAEQQTPLATLGLCLADGTPIAAIVTRDCAGSVVQSGWLNLATGAYSTGQPPAGVVACGESRSIETSGTFCDVDTFGTVLALVLIEYTYNPDGTVAAAQPINAATGQPYTVQGQITACPAGVAQPEQDPLVLCETRDDGTVIQFVRDFRRDENGTISGHTDYTLDGEVYDPTGSIGLCPSPCTTQNVIQAERCDDTDGDGLPDVTYVELLAVDCAGTVTPIGTYTCDLAATYVPVAAVDCDADADAGAPRPVGVQARRVHLTAGATWSAADYPTLRAASVTAVDGIAEITTADGVSPLAVGETAAWRTNRDIDARLAGPLLVTAQTGSVTVDFTTGVDL